MPSKQLGVSGLKPGETPREFLMEYYKSATDSLLFLKNIESISFQEVISLPDLEQGLAQEKSSQGSAWIVSSERDHVNVSQDTRIKEFTIKGKITNPKGEPRETSAKWCVISGGKKEDDLSNELVKIQMQDRLEAKYGLAALISETNDFRGRNYMSLPLVMTDDETMEIPVHVNAVSNHHGYFFSSALNL